MKICILDINRYENLDRKAHPFRRIRFFAALGVKRLILLRVGGGGLCRETTSECLNPFCVFFRKGWAFPQSTPQANSEASP
jgi:hypothetical protein